MRLLVLIQAMLFLRKASMILMMICSEAFVVPICLSPWLHPLLKTPFYEILVFKNLMILLTGSSRRYAPHEDEAYRLPEPASQA